MFPNKNIFIKKGNIMSYTIQYILAMMKFRSMYGSVFTQLFDQVSDIGVIAQLYFLQRDEYRDNEIECFHMNAYYLFAASLFYRVYSSVLIYLVLSQFGSSFKYRILLTILQLFDLLFIVTLKINCKLENTKPCNPQRYITNLESVFEAAPQVIIQLYFLITLNMKQNIHDLDKDTRFAITNTNLLVIVSLFFSLMRLLLKNYHKMMKLYN